MKKLRILILYKQSTYKHIFLNTKRFAVGQVKQTNAIAKRFIDTHLEHYQTLKKVEAFLKERKWPYTKMLRGRSGNLRQFDLIITVGGDGTFLEAASQATTQQMLGINSDPKWSVGRFCLANNKNFADILSNVLNGKAKIRLLNRMKVTLLKSKKSVTVLNDILICHRNPATMSRYYFEFKGHVQEQRSSGIWIATAAGSTGAIHSAGGIILNEKSKSLQFVIREPYTGKTGPVKCRSAVFDDKSSIMVTSLMTAGIIYIDGSHISLPFPFGEKLQVRNSTYPLKLVAG
ncbi:MAG: NAD(+)/NADH kinase [Candidatus Omnitrophica bacterium]|nr:NAD(+)/NADH kinase [Candidatus Omnitrophota bacterium]